MMLRFRYGNVNDEYEYQYNQLHAIDSYLDEDQIRQRFADTYRSCQTGKGRIQWNTATFTFPKTVICSAYLYWTHQCLYGT
jgi:hypothetical protein